MTEILSAALYFALLAGFACIVYWALSGKADADGTIYDTNADE